jgi:hypothetical protein
MIGSAFTPRSHGLRGNALTGRSASRVVAPRRAAERLGRAFPRRAWERGGGVLRLWKLATVLAVAGYLLFAHGCHGDEDNELLLRTRVTIQQKAGAAWLECESPHRVKKSIKRRFTSCAASFCTQ